MQSEHNAPFLRIGTRGSPLALVQAEQVRRHLAAGHGVSESAIEIVTFVTSGDRSQQANRPMVETGGKGTFSKEIEAALMNGSIDLAVHSAKDMATRLPDGLIMPFFLEREDVRDAFLSPLARRLADLPKGARLGTSSLRRAAQMRHFRPDLDVIQFRGNVGTRLKKLADGVADATLLAAAGLRRLGMASEANEFLDPQRFPTAPGQGAIGIELREDDSLTFARAELLNHADTRDAVRAERAMLARLDGSCRTPIGAYSTIRGTTYTLLGEILSPDGRQAFRAQASGDIADAEKIGDSVGEEIIRQAGPQFIEALTKG